MDHKRDHSKRIAVPKYLTDTILEEAHLGIMCGHFSSKRTFSLLVYHWWWESMYSDTVPLSLLITIVI